MFIADPVKIATWSEDRLMEGYLQNRLAILEHALNRAHQELAASTVEGVAEFVRESTGVDLKGIDLQHVLALYPYSKAKLADYGSEDTEVRGMLLDVIAHAFLGTRWPNGHDACDMPAFLERLRFAVKQAAPIFAGMASS